MLQLVCQKKFGERWACEVGCSPVVIWPILLSWRTTSTFSSQLWRHDRKYCVPLSRAFQSGYLFGFPMGFFLAVVAGGHHMYLPRYLPFRMFWYGTCLELLKLSMACLNVSLRYIHCGSLCIYWLIIQMYYMLDTIIYDYVLNSVHAYGPLSAGQFSSGVAGAICFLLSRTLLQQPQERIWKTEKLYE